MASLVDSLYVLILATNIKGTPRKINMEPENPPLEVRKIIDSKPSFSGSMLIFGGVLLGFCWGEGWNPPVFFTRQFFFWSAWDWWCALSHLGYWYWPYGGFLKWWCPTTMGFILKMIIWGCFGGYHHLRKLTYHHKKPVKRRFQRCETTTRTTPRKPAVATAIAASRIYISQSWTHFSCLNDLWPKNAGGDDNANDQKHGRQKHLKNGPKRCRTRRIRIVQLIKMSFF